MHLNNKLSLPLVLCIIACTWSMLAAAPYQELAPRAGHVPVYIRVGDTPLTEIHPGLAEAFHEFESASLLLEDDKKPEQEPHAVATTTPSTTTKVTTESDIASFDAVRGDDGETADGKAQSSPATAATVKTTVADDEAKEKATNV